MNTPATLRMRIFLVFGLLFAAVLLADQVIERYGLPFTSFEGRIRERQQEIFRALDLTADLKKERLLLWIEERKADAAVVARSPLVRSALAGVEDRYHELAGPGREAPWESLRQESDYAAARGQLEVILDSYRAYDRIDIVDLHSGVVIISTSGDEEGAVIFDREVSFADLSARPGSLVDVWRHSQDGGFHLHIARIIEAPAGGDSGLVVLMHVNTSFFLEPLLHTGDGLGETGEALLVNRDSLTLTPLKFPLGDGTRAEPLLFRVTTEPATLATAGEEGIATARDYRGVLVLAAYRHIKVSPEVGWGLVVKRDRAEVYRGYRRENLLSLILILVGIIFVVGCTYVLSASLSAPLTDLSGAAGRIRKGDLDARVEVTGTVEMRILAEAFNAMADKIKDYTRELQEKNEELEAFVYTAAHDLKNPLIGVHGFINLLERSLKGKLEERQEYLLKKADQTLRQFERLLDDLLAYSQVRTAPADESSTALPAVMERVKAELWEEIKGSGAAIHLQKDLPEVRMGESRAYQIFSNLISNSLRYAREGVAPEVEIGVVPRPRMPVPEDHALFFVTDNGKGIAPEWHDRVFGLFVRVDGATGEGSGTGLAIVRRIVRQGGGTIWLESTPGSGTTVYFTLPAAF